MNEETPAEIKTEKKYSELTTEEIKGMDDSQADTYARQQGWVPAEEFRGDKSKAKSSKDFLIDGKDELPVVRNNLRKQTEKVEELSKLVTDNTKMYQNAMKKQEAKYKKELEKKIQEAEKKVATAKANLDVEAVAEASQDVVEFKNELNEVESNATQRQAQEEQSGQRKIEEWNTWRASSEANDLLMKDPVRFMGFERIVGEIYMQNKELPTSQIIQLAKERAYPKAEAPNVQGTNPSISKTSSSKLTAKQKQIIKGNIDATVFVLKKKGLTAEEEKKYRKEEFASQEKQLLGE